MHVSIMRLIIAFCGFNRNLDSHAVVGIDIELTMTLGSNWTIIVPA